MTIPAPDPAPPRRSRRPLPPRRHLPGQGPHPSTEGFVAVAEWDWACDLFDFRYYWEAHEAWEAAWAPLPHDTPEARLLQGLICGAAFVIKQHQGHVDGATRLLDRARAHLAAAAPLGPRPRGVDLDELLRRLEAFRGGGPWPTLPRG